MRTLRRALPLLVLAGAGLPALGMLRAWLFGPANLYRIDSTLYYAASLQGLRGGWHRLYDLDLQRETFRSISPDLWWFPNVYTPAMAAFFVPFTWLPLEEGYRIWSAILFVCFAGCAVALAPGGPLWKAAHLALALVPYPVALGLGIGQVIALQMAALAAAYLWLRQDREALAGACIAVIAALKPHCLLLVPFVLLAAGRRRAFWSFVLTGAAIALLLLCLVGLDGARAYIDRLRYAGSHPEEFWVGWAITMPRHFESTAGRVLAQAAAATAALVAAGRHRDLELSLAAGLVGSLVVTPYIHLDDWMLLFPAAWLTLRRAPWAAVPLAGAYALLLLCTHTGTPVWGRWVLLFECVWLVGLAVLPVRFVAPTEGARGVRGPGGTDRLRSAGA